jgi:NTP pyrophosphatase (non-canonical NTP hydrolase)
MTTLKDLQVTLAAFAAERDWDRWHTPENLAKSISIEAAELLECYQWGKEPDPQAVRHELADVLIYCLQMTRRLGVDPAEIILEKLEVTRKKYPAAVKNKDAREGSSNGAEGEQNPAV